MVRRHALALALAAVASQVAAGADLCDDSPAATFADESYGSSKYTSD